MVFTSIGVLPCPLNKSLSVRLNQPNRGPHRSRRLSVSQRRARVSRVLCLSDKAPQVISIGEALFDMLANDYDVPRDQVKSWTPKAGGAPCNVAVGLAKLGVKVSFISALGNDDLGDNLIDTLTSAGVLVSDIKRRPEPTRDVYVTRKSSGEREFVGFGKESDQYADCHIDPLNLPVEKIQGAHVFVCGTLGQAFKDTGEATRSAVSIARDANVCVLIDVNWRPVFFKNPQDNKSTITDFVKQADIVKLTNDEAQWMFGIDSSTALQEPRQVLEHLPTCKGVLVTAGDEGAAYSFRIPSGIYSGWFPAFQVEVVDTTGAGDAFTSGFIYQMLKCGGLDALLASPEAIDAAVEFASASGGFTASALGSMEAQPKSSMDVHQLIEKFEV